MVKNVLHKAGIQLDAALVALGWTAFLAGMFANAKHPALAVCLMAVARVLP